MSLSKLYLLAFLVFFSVPLKAAQNATVITEGAIIYKDSSFDAPILGYFSQGKKVRISSKIFGAFYRVAFKKGVIGYISDIDVQIEGQAFRPRGLGESESKPSGAKRPYLGGKYWGLKLESVEFADTVGNFNASSTTNFLGANISFPMGFLFDGSFTLALNLLYSLETPTLYKGLSTGGEPSGFVVLGDAQLLYGLASLMQRKLDIYLGAGFMVGYTDVSVVQTNRSGSVSSASFGGVFSLGAAYQFSSLVVKFEPKFYVEEDTYMGLGFGLMKSF